jgi:site-specific DNA recombinase
MTRAAIYVRISQDREGAGLGVQRQEEDCRAVAAQLGWDIVSVLSDNDVSAYSKKPRPRYRELLEAIAAESIDAVLIWHTDRLHRSPAELEEYVTLVEQHNVMTHAVKAGRVDLATPAGRMIARMLGAAARYEVEHKADRITRKHLQSAMAGRWRGGPRPFGWRPKPDGTADLVPLEAEAIRYGTESLIAGAPLGEIARYLNESGIATINGNAWATTTVRKMLLRPKNAGLSEYRDEVVADMVGWPAAVTVDQWRAVDAIIRNPARRLKQPNVLRWWMAGVARCECGAVMRSMIGNGKSPGRTTYIACSEREPGKPHAAIQAELLEQWMTAAVIARMTEPLAAPAETRDRSEEIAALKAELDELAEAAGARQVTVRQFAIASEGLQRRLAEIQPTDIAPLAARALATAENPAAEWAAMPAKQKRTIVEQLLETVTVKPCGRGRRYLDPEESLVLTWRV